MTERRQTLMLQCGLKRQSAERRRQCKTRRHAGAKRFEWRTRAVRPSGNMSSALPIREERSVRDTIADILTRLSELHSAFSRGYSCSSSRRGSAGKAEQSKAAQRAVCVALRRVGRSDRIGPDRPIRWSARDERSNDLRSRRDRGVEWSGVVQKRGEGSRGEAERATCASRA